MYGLILFILQFGKVRIGILHRKVMSILGEYSSKFCPRIIDFLVLPCVIALRTFNDQSSNFVSGALDHALSDI